MTASNRVLPFFTIGHSTRPVVELADLLTAAEVGVLVDVRAVPRSRTNPQFNKDVLPAALASTAITSRLWEGFEAGRPPPRPP